MPLCVMDFPAVEAICGNRGDKLIRLPLETMDKGVILTPKTWEDLVNYLYDIEGALKKCQSFQP